MKRLRAFCAWWRRNFWSHKWVRPGRNPYRRICTVCGQREESYCRDLESWAHAWWEVHEDGDLKKHWS